MPLDGLHALDIEHYIATHPHSALAQLGGHGVTYSNARTPRNSDSFPGLLALVTGGSPVTTGLFYDASYDRKVFDPTNITCSGRIVGATCEVSTGLLIRLGFRFGLETTRPTFVSL